MTPKATPKPDLCPVCQRKVPIEWCVNRWLRNNLRIVDWRWRCKDCRNRADEAKQA